jgi:signal transduction histidine kinase
MTLPLPTLAPSLKPWIILIVDDDEDIHAVTAMTLKQTKYFGLPVEVVSARSAKQAEALVQGCDPERFAVAVVDVVMEHDFAGLDLVDKLRAKFGAPLQIVLRTGQPGVIGAEAVANQYDISAYLTKAEATPDRLRMAVNLGIRNFRTHSAMRVLCDSLTNFGGLFETASSTAALDVLLDNALGQYAAVWQFEHLLVPDIRDENAHARVAEPWHKSALRQIEPLGLHSHRSVSIVKLSSDHPPVHLWGCLLRPLGGRFQGAFAFRMAEQPTEVLVHELQALLRGWLLSRESTQMRQLAVDEEKVRDQMHRERRDAIAQMVAGIAHEVNTPLGIANAAAATIGEIAAKPHFTQLADQEVYAEDLDDLKTSVSLLRRNIARADELIQSFKRLSVRQLVDQREEVDLLACVEDCVKLFGPMAKRTGIEVRIDNRLDPSAARWLGFPGHLSQVLLNLMQNADRYAYADRAPGTPAVVEVSLSSALVKDVPEFSLVVRDHGAGISKENLPLIFEPFFTTGRAKGGTGLGLAIVHNIITSIFGGTIRCESSPGAGTQFVLRFSHCKDAAKPAEVEAEEGDQVQVFQDFVDLQQKLARGQGLTTDEQLRFAAVRQRVDGLLAVQFRGHEKRRAPRIPCSRAGQVIKPTGEREPLEIRDMSEVGALLWMAEPVTRGEALWIQYSEEPELVLASEVVTCIDMRTANMSASVWQVGVRFEVKDETSQRNLKILLAQLTMEYWS